MESSLKEAAYNHRLQGLNIVLLKEKKPLHEWRHWQTRRQSCSDFEALPWDEADGFAIIGGSKLDNGLFFAAIDFDVKNVSEEAKRKGKQILRSLPITQIEETPSGGQHWIYFCRVKPKTVSAFHNDCALELLGENKLVIMAPSKGYRRLNDNSPTIVQDVESVFYNALLRIGIKAQKKGSHSFDSKKLTAKPFRDKTPPCVNALLKGTTEGLRNDSAIRLAGFLLNSKRVEPEKAWMQLYEWNLRNSPPLPGQELKNVFESALKNGYCFGCDDPLLSKFCVEEVCAISARRLRAFYHKVSLL